MARKKQTPSVEISNPEASRLPRQRGEFGQPAPVEPISKKPRARLGESPDGASVEITGTAATTKTKARGGSA